MLAEVQMSRVPTPRCAAHGLASAPDGGCVLCRRELGEVIGESTETDSGRRVVRGLLGVTLLVCCGSAAAWVVREDGKRATPPLIAADAHGRVAVVEEKPAAEPGARRDDVKARGTPEEQLAEAERARVLREQEQRDQEQAELQRRSSSEAANQRKLAEQVRDRERHEQVMRDLDKSSRHNARGKVRITMFSTSWCGVCKKARAYMLDKNIPFSEHDIEQDEVAKERARALNPRGGVPTILVDELLLVGFSPGSLEQSIDVAARRYQGS